MSEVSRWMPGLACSTASLADRGGSKFPTVGRSHLVTGGHPLALPPVNHTAASRGGSGPSWMGHVGPSHTQLEHHQVQRSAPRSAICRRPSVPRRPGSRRRSPVHGRSWAGSDCEPMGCRWALSERKDYPTQVRQLSRCCQASRRFLMWRPSERPARSDSAW